MFITLEEQGELQIHFDATDQKAMPIIITGLICITLSADKAKELEDRLEEALKEK